MSDVDLSAFERQLHELMRARARALIEDHRLALPRLTMPVPGAESPQWFPVPGMAGGFKYWFSARDGDLALLVESWSRVVDGSGQRHEITREATRLLEEGFV